MRQTWTSDDGCNFDTEDECRRHEDEVKRNEELEQEFLERIVSFVLKEAESHDGYPAEFIASFRSVGVAKIASNLQHIENFLSLVLDIKERSHKSFWLWKTDENYSEYKDFLPEQRWMKKNVFKVYPLEDLQEERHAKFEGLTPAYRDYPGLF